MYAQALAPIASSSSFSALGAAGALSAGLALWSYLYPNQDGMVAHALDAMGTAIGPSKLDLLETVGLGIGSIHLIKFALDSTPYLCNFSLLPRMLTAMAGGFLSAKAYQETFKTPLIHRKIEALQKDSASLGKKALIIDSTVGDCLGGLQTNRCYLTNAAVMAENHAIQRLSVKSEKAFSQSLQCLPKETYDVLWLRTHGRSLFLEFGTDFYLMQGAQILYDLASKVKRGGKVILESCDAGFGEWNIAQDFSKVCPSATVYAPETWIHTFMGMELDEAGVPSFNDGVFFKGKNVTRIYRAGKALT